MAFVRMLTILIKDKEIGKYVVPIVPDESRTFGMEGMFRQIGIYSPVGQLYTPVDIEQIMSYKEAKDGQILEEGINEAGSFCSWIAAGSSYSTNNLPMVPFYIYYSMFGFQRVGDLAWAAGDMQVRGFLLGGTSGRTTLAGEGLQHQDGHSHLQSATIPNCISYDPTYGYELAVIIHDGMRRMYQNNENVFYYITVLNENYNHPALPKGVEQGIIKGMYLLQESKKKKDQLTVQLLGCGAILREVIAAADLLAKDFNIAADIWSVTSFTELRREALTLERQQLLNPTEKISDNFVTQCLKNRAGPIIAATDYMKSFADQIRAFVPNSYTVLGTDGFGRSDTREQLRYFFEVNRYYIAIAALKALADEKKIPMKNVSEAIKKYKIDPNKPEPVTV
jgi:pyruvate dehydrogenase E1 component